MEATKMAKSALKKGVNELFNEVFASPFQVIKFVKKYKNDPRVANVLSYYGVQNLTLEMLLTYDNGTDRPVFCELKKVREIEYLTGYELQVIKIGKAFYELVPISFSVNDFFKSLDSMRKLQKEEKRKAEKAAQELERAKAKEFKEKERAENKERRKQERATAKKAKKEEEKVKKVAEKAKALASEFSDIPENVLLQIAAKMLAA